MKSIKNQTIYLTIALFISSLLTLYLGAIPFTQVLQEAKARLMGNSTQWNSLLDERLPRLIILILTGASLSVSGAITQTLFRHPLASPSILGVSAGGSLCVVFVFIFGLHVSYPWILSITAVAGSLMTLAFIFLLSRCFGELQIHTLILTSIAISSILIAAQESLLFALRDRWHLVQTISEWTSGSTIDRSWHHVHLQLPLCLIGLIGSWRLRHEMNLLALGEEEARNLGVDVPTVRWQLFVCVALLIGAAIAALGTISFIGLILPNILRTLHGPNHRTLLPLCALTGSTVLTIIDNLLRLFKITALSIGNIFALIGGCYFLFLLMKESKSSYRRQAC